MKFSNINPIIPIGIGAGLLILIASSEKPKGIDFKKLTSTTSKGFIILKCDKLRFLNIPKMNEYLIIQLRNLSTKPQHVVPSKIDIVDFCEDFLWIMAPDCYPKYMNTEKATKLNFIISYYFMYGALVNYFDNILQMNDPKGTWIKFFDSIEQLNNFRQKQYEKFDNRFEVWFKVFQITKEQVMNFYQKINSGEIYEISSETLSKL